jgi:hypothetical protein
MENYVYKYFNICVFKRNAGRRYEYVLNWMVANFACIYSDIYS